MRYALADLSSCRPLCPDFTVLDVKPHRQQIAAQKRLPNRPVLFGAVLRCRKISAVTHHVRQQKITPRKPIPHGKLFALPFNNPFHPVNLKTVTDQIFRILSHVLPVSTTPVETIHLNLKSQHGFYALRNWLCL